ncbi:MAG: hypothetical protein IPM32_00405 [Ignavibacteriae bacterium]|nr:hypothetical protein [Ignavibacteriota bacterium]
MKIIAPNNIFSSIFYLSIDEKNKPELILKESSLLLKELNKHQNAIAFIPSLDLINQKELFVSQKFVIAFEAYISNTFLYFAHDNFNKLLLKGDISTNEVLLSKIIFQEIYNIQPEIELDVHDKFHENKNYLVSGNLNWIKNRYNIGTCFSEHISEFIEFPYVNYLLVSNSKTDLEKFHSVNENLLGNISKNFVENVKKINLGDEINEFIINNKSTVFFDFNSITNESFAELINLLYFRKIIDDMFDVKFL